MPDTTPHRNKKYKKDFDWASGKSRPYFCEICKKEIKGTATVYLGDLYHGECTYPGP